MSLAPDAHDDRPPPMRRNGAVAVAPIVVPGSRDEHRPRDALLVEPLDLRSPQAGVEGEGVRNRIGGIHR